ncbi:MAG: hypothetical protein ACRDVP_04920, partial [Acidimicrobiales bacterium]
MIRRVGRPGAAGMVLALLIGMAPIFASSASGASNGSSNIPGVLALPKPARPKPGGTMTILL